jgi:hypothetical protein
MMAMKVSVLCMGLVLVLLMINLVVAADPAVNANIQVCPNDCWGCLS